MTGFGRAALLLLLVPGALAAAQAPDRGLSYGIIIYGEPAFTDPVPPHEVPAALDAVIAEQRVEIMGRRLSLSGPVRIGAPFNVTLAAGTPFRLFRTAQGTRWCKVGIPGVPYRPPADAAGNIYPGTCLIDGDADGAFDHVRMIPYEPARAEPRELAIEPARLGPAADAADPRVSRLHVYRRVRIAETAEREIVLVVEHASAPPSAGAPDYQAAGAEARTSLALRPGATASIAGLALRVSGGPGAWRIAATGRLAPWAFLEQDGTAARLGPYYLPPRED
jgi:hypothetical protein